MKKMLLLVLPVAMVGCTLSSDLRLALSKPNVKTEFFSMQFNPAGKTHVGCEYLYDSTGKEVFQTGSQVVVGFQATGTFKTAYISLKDADSQTQYRSFGSFPIQRTDLSAANDHYAAAFTLLPEGSVPKTLDNEKQEREVTVDTSAANVAGRFQAVIYATSDTGARTSDVTTQVITVYKKCLLK